MIGNYFKEVALACFSHLSLTSYYYYYYLKGPSPITIANREKLPLFHGHLMNLCGRIPSELCSFRKL